MMARRPNTARGTPDPLRPPNGGGEADAALAACRRGDPGAWEDLVRSTSALVMSVPRRLGLTEAESEDVFQAVYLALVDRIDEIRRPDALRAWLATVAQRESVNLVRRDRRRRRADTARAASEPHDPPLDPDPGHLEQSEEAHRLGEALHRLGGPCERLLRALFRRQVDADYTEIARELDMPVGSIGPTRARCFAKLRPILRDLGLDSPADPDPS